MRRLFTVTFHRIPMGAAFSYNGSRCRKRSTRTATLLDYARTFYFGQHDTCTVTEDVRNTIITVEAYPCIT